MNHDIVFGHQGDVPFIRLDGITEDDMKSMKLAKSNDDGTGTVTLVEGEGPAHKHRVVQNAESQTYTATPDVANENKFFVSMFKGPTELQHYNTQTKTLTKEHDTLTLPAGAYLFSGQRTVNYENLIVRLTD